MRIHDVKSASQSGDELSAIRHFMKKKLENDYEKRKENIKDLLKIIDEYKASETNGQ